MAVAPWADSVTSILSCRAAIAVVAAAIDNRGSSEDKEEVAELSVARVDPLLRLLDFVNLLDQ
ncbi:hypothetical protein L195_g030867 [Trifolium pratense]|uniref:Uncharacterized protein n=1 Tax=Trifolium pratense TaxID=57577 RepID=A0A2K3L8S9_TRIPR|nr:hypothetical protein L195_g030867 [Trifolium pratense]